MINNIKNLDSVPGINNINRENVLFEIQVNNFFGKGGKGMGAKIPPEYKIHSLEINEITYVIIQISLLPSNAFIEVENKVFWT